MLCLMAAVFITGSAATAISARFPTYSLTALLGSLAVVNLAAAVAVWLVDRDG